MNNALDTGQWLAEYRSCWENKEAEWLLRLVEFDRSGGWEADGQRSCAAWMMWKLKMGRSTAFEKLQVGYALDSRAVLLEAFRDGRLSYSALRLIATIDDADEDVDEALVGVAAADGASIADVEQMVRLYRLFRDQELPPPEPELKRQVSSPRKVGDGLSRITITLRDLEMKEFLLALKSFDDPLFREAARGGAVDESAAADDPRSDSDTDSNDDGAVEESAAADGPGADEPVDESAAADGSGADEPVDESAAADQRYWREDGTVKARRADAFMNLVASSLSGDGGRAAGDDRYMVNVVKVVGGIGATLIDGEPVDKADMGAIECDCSKVTHYVTEKGEPLHLGRKTREWSTAQRPAAQVRDGGHCRFPGCSSRFVDLHHIDWWEHGGRTDIDRAMSCCRHHHTLIHKKGFTVEGDPNDDLRFSRRDGTRIGTTRPAIAGRLSLRLAS